MRRKRSGSSPTMTVKLLASGGSVGRRRARWQLRFGRDPDRSLPTSRYTVPVTCQLTAGRLAIAQAESRPTGKGRIGDRRAK